MLDAAKACGRVKAARLKVVPFNTAQQADNESTKMKTEMRIAMQNGNKHGTSQVRMAYPHSRFRITLALLHSHLAEGAGRWGRNAVGS
jgi:hypothetical protein